MAPRFETGQPEVDPRYGEMPTPGESSASGTVPPGRQPLLPPDFKATYSVEEDGEVSVFDFAVPVYEPAIGGINPAQQSATGSSNMTMRAQGPRYYENDQAFIWIGDNSATSPDDLSTESLARYQRNFLAAGLLSERDYNTEAGFWGPETIKANRELLRTANVNGLTATATLSRLASSAQLREQNASSPSAGGRIAPTIRLTNTDDLKATFRQVARQTTGGVFVEDSQLDAMVEAYHQKERDYQLSLASGAGETEAAPSVGTFAETSLEEMDPGAATGNRFARMTAVLGSLMG